MNELLLALLLSSNYAANAEKHLSVAAYSSQRDAVMMVWEADVGPDQKVLCRSGNYTLSRMDFPIIELSWTAKCVDQPVVQHTCPGTFNSVLGRIECTDTIQTAIRPNIFADGFEFQVVEFYEFSH